MTCLAYALSTESQLSPRSTLLSVENPTSQRYKVYQLGLYCSDSEARLHILPKNITIMENHHLSALTAASVRERHGRLLAGNSNQKPNTMDHLTISPLFATQSLTQSVQITSLTRTLQCGLLAEMLLERDNALEESPSDHNLADKRLFFNITTPSSIFICGSQGSGKSHTLSCLLENCLADSDATVLPRPLSALLFHYDTFISDDGGSPCEAAFLASLPGIRVRIVCAPTNLCTIQVSLVLSSVHSSSTDKNWRKHISTWMST
jgi:hypothetical protein